MKPLTKEQAIKISELHHQWYREHPKATREELEKAFYKIKYKVLKETSNQNARMEPIFGPYRVLSPNQVVYIPPPQNARYGSILGFVFIY